jgi:hypothetical protein
MSKFTHDDAVSGKASELCVMCSAAGYYVGTYWNEYNADGERIWAEPNSRESGYFDTESEAADWLKWLRQYNDE